MRPLPSLVFICTFVLGATGASPAEFIKPEVSSTVSEDGTVALEWSSGKGNTGTFTIERAASPSFQEPMVVYQGPDTATFVSGLPEGSHHFRIREGEEPWGDSVLTVEVEFVSRTFVAILLSAGTLCLIFLVAALVQGQRTVKPVDQMSKSGASSSRPRTFHS